MAFKTVVLIAAAGVASVAKALGFVDVLPDVRLEPIPETPQTTEDVTPQSRRAEQRGVVDLFITGRPGNDLFGLPILRGPAARRAPLRARHRALSLSPARRDGIPVEDQAILPVVSSVVDNFHEMSSLISFGETRGVDSVRLDMIQNTGGHLTSDYAPMNVADENHPLHMAFLEKRSAIRASACRPHNFTMPRTGANARWQ